MCGIYMQIKASLSHILDFKANYWWRSSGDDHLDAACM